MSTYPQPNAEIVKRIGLYRNLDVVHRSTAVWWAYVQPGVIDYVICFWCGKHLMACRVADHFSDGYG